MYALILVILQCNEVQKRFPVCVNVTYSYATTVRGGVILDLKLDRSSSRTMVSGVKLCSHQCSTRLTAIPFLLRRGLKSVPSIRCWFLELRGAGLSNNFCIRTSTLDDLHIFCCSTVVVPMLAVILSLRRLYALCFLISEFVRGINTSYDMTNTNSRIGELDYIHILICFQLAEWFRMNFKRKRCNRIRCRWRKSSTVFHDCRKMQSVIAYTTWARECSGSWMSWVSL